MVFYQSHGACKRPEACLASIPNLESPCLQVYDASTGRVQVDFELLSRSYLVATAVPSRGIVLLAGGDMENGTTTDLVEAFPLYP